MIDIVDRLRFDATRCELQFSKGVAGNIDEAAKEIDRLRNMCIRREEFIAQNNLWREFSKWLSEPPHSDDPGQPTRDC